MYPKVIIEKNCGMGSYFYLFQTTVMLSGWLSSSQMSVKGKANLPETQICIAQKAHSPNQAHMLSAVPCIPKLTVRDPADCLLAVS